MMNNNRGLARASRRPALTQLPMCLALVAAACTNNSGGGGGASGSGGASSSGGSASGGASSTGGSGSGGTSSSGGLASGGASSSGGSASGGASSSGGSASGGATRTGGSGVNPAGGSGSGGASSSGGSASGGASSSGGSASGGASSSGGSASGGASGSGGSSGSAGSSTPPIISLNYQKLISTADINYTGTITNSNYGLPVGTGIMDSLVWNSSDGSTLQFQINRVGVFGYNSAATGVDSQSDYGYGIGLVNINLGTNALPSSTKQHLSLYDGQLAIQGNGVSANIIADMNSDVFLLKIADTRSSPSPITIDLVMLQNPNVTSGSHTATTATTANGGQIRLQQTFQQAAATGFTDFNLYNASAAVIDASGRTGTTSSPNNKTVRLTLPAATGTAYIYIGTHSSMNSADDVVALATDKVNKSKTAGFDSTYSANQSWWQDFWSKSYIYLPDQTSAEYQIKWIYYLYLSAISQRGDYPSKFTLYIWNTGGLEKEWGSEYWGFNQECLHYSFDGANHGELQQPFFKMDTNNYNNYATAAQQQWGSQGIFVDETECFNGPEKLPANIATDLQAFMLNGTGPSSSLSSFAGSRMNECSRWELQPTYWTTWNTINASERAEHFWNHYLYSLDANFLSTQAYPMLKGAAEFYRNFPNLKMDSDGYYHIYRTNLHEHIMGGKDVVDDLAFIRGVLQAAKKASEILGIDPDLGPEWQAIVDKLTPYPKSGQSDTIGSLTSAQPTWGQARTPAAQVRTDALSGPESPRLRMVENYNVLTLETADQGLDGGDWTIANNTYLAHPAYSANNSGSYGPADGRYLLDAAMMGRKEFGTVLASLNSKIDGYIGNSTNREGFPTSDGEEFSGYGILSAGLQDGLMQSISPSPGSDPVIRVFPAWNINTAAYFKLLAKGGFLVSSAAKNGAIEFMEINSQLGGTCRMRNPWSGATMTLYRNGVKAEDLTGSLVSFSTSVGEDIVVVKQGVSPDSLKESLP